ncbi:MAG: tryptophan synthase subunit alpha [Gammaproteobacteria bacterium]|nr:tryptophan synthase subunit alpha [Gammaproteobacteria bacterium]|tara:strand:+ start:5763 stop:6530 length:768 start_codon:yes stop_codon:yes gene_type:complete
MKAYEKISNAIIAANESGRTALVPFITAGYPKPKKFTETLKSIASVGDVVEIGVPFSDPMADGMTIQRSSFIALQNGVSLKWILDELDSVNDEINTPMILMSYLNPLLAFGYEKLAERALKAGVCGVIVPDLPYEESDELRKALDKQGLGLIQLISPATPEERLRKLCDASRGFVYAVTVTGITGGASMSQDLSDYLNKVSSFSKTPVCAGFGIRQAKDVKAVGQYVNGAIIGSALVEVLEREENPKTFLEELLK